MYKIHFLFLGLSVPYLVASQSSSEATSSLSSLATPSYTTVTYYDPCTSSSDPVTSTVTATTTIEVCPLCTGPPNQASTTTSYTTVYETVDSDNTVIYATYTIIENCCGGCNGGPGWIPDGFVVASQSCDVSGTKSSIWVTEPCGCTSTGGWAAPTNAYVGGSGGSGSGSGSGSNGGNAGAATAGSVSTGNVPTATPVYSSSGTNTMVLFPGSIVGAVMLSLAVFL